MEGPLPHVLRALGVVAIIGVLVGGCGGSTTDREGAASQAAAFSVEVVTARFPARQQAGNATTLTISVRNTGTRTIPNLAVSLDGLRSVSTQRDQADPNVARWIVDAEPAAAVTAYVDTWAGGPLGPGDIRRYRWTLTPTMVGPATLAWRLGGNLTGSATVVGTNGSPTSGAFAVKVGRRGANDAGRVDPTTGALRSDNAGR